VIVVIVGTSFDDIYKGTPLKGRPDTARGNGGQTGVIRSLPSSLPLSPSPPVLMPARISFAGLPPLTVYRRYHIYRDLFRALSRPRFHARLASPRFMLARAEVAAARFTTLRFFLVSRE